MSSPWRPMLAVSGELPAAAQDDRWGYEFKWDGVRALCVVLGGRARLISRNERDISSSYPEVLPLAAELPDATVLDGELVAFVDEDGRSRPSFGLLQRRMHVAAPSAALLAAAPVTFLLFDVLLLGAVDLLTRPYVERRTALEELRLAGPAWQTPPWFAGGGAEVQAASRAGRLEGVLAKRLDSAYRPGQRSDAWRKIKNMRTRDVVIGGWKPGQGGRGGQLGSLMMGVPGPGGLHYVGNVGSGFTGRILDDLGRRLAGLASTESPFVEVPRPLLRDARFVRPELVGEVQYGEQTGDGRLRHPSWRGLRSDIDPPDVTPLEVSDGR